MNTQLGSEQRKTKNIPWNKGLKGIEGEYRKNETSFKSGKNHPKYKPIGSERVERDGYIVMKVADRKWQQKHRFLWERDNGKIPKGHVVIFGNGNKRDFRPENLILVSRNQLATINKFSLIFEDEELTRSGIALSDLIQAKTKMKRKLEGATHADNE